MSRFLETPRDDLSSGMDALSLQSADTEYRDDLACHPDGSVLDEPSPQPTKPTAALVQAAEKLIGEGHSAIEVSQAAGLAVSVILPIVQRITRKPIEPKRKPTRPAQTERCAATKQSKPTPDNLTGKKLVALANRLQELAGHHQVVARDLWVIATGLTKGGQS